MLVQYQIAHRNHRLGAALALACACGAASAETPGDRYWAELSYFYPEISSTARLDLTATKRPGTEIKLEDDLNLSDRKGTPYVTLGMRLGQAWRMEFEYYELNRSASKAITRQIDWGDTTFPVGAQVDSKLDTTVYRLTGGYSFYRAPTAEAGVSFGAHVTDFKTALSGSGTAGAMSADLRTALARTSPSGVVTTTFHREERSTLVPLPTIGLYGSYGFADHWQVRGKVDYLSLKYGDYDGSLINTLVAIDWRFAKNWGAGIGYRYVNYKLNVDKSNFRGEINYKFSGPTFFVNAAF